MPNPAGDDEHSVAERDAPGSLSRQWLLIGVTAVLALTLQLARTARPVVPNATTTAPLADATVAGKPLIDPATLAWVDPLRDDVTDQTLGIRAGESAAFQSLLDHATRVAPFNWDDVAPSEVFAVNVVSEPATLRGELVDVTGELLALRPLSVPATTDSPARDLLDAWIRTPDSPLEPVRVIVAHRSPELPSEPGRSVWVRARGHFFKREGYLAGSGLRTTSTIIADRLDPWTAPPTRLGAAFFSPAWFRVTAAVSVALLVSLCSWLAVEGRAARELRLSRLRPRSASLAALERVQFVSVEQSLRSLAERHRREEIARWKARRATLSPPPLSVHDGEVRDAEFIDLPTPPPLNRPPQSR